MAELVKVQLEFVEQAEGDNRTGFKFIDCMAEVMDSEEKVTTDKYGHQHRKKTDWLGGMVGASYQIHRKGRRFYISPKQFLEAVDHPIQQQECAPEYCI